MSNDKILLIYFWISWSGTALLPVACILGFKFQVTPAGAALIVCFFCTIALSIASALCLEKFPRLAKLGMNSVGLSFLIASAVLWTMLV